MDDLSDDELSALESLAERATPGPWFVRQLDDSNAMSFIAVGTTPPDDTRPRWPHFDGSSLIAATLVQEPRYVDIADGRWEENARFIASVRSALPRLLAELKRRRSGD